MSALVVDCSNHRQTTLAGSGGSIVVEAYEHVVYLNLKYDGTSNVEDPDVTRMLTPAEARSLAAALVFFAHEVER